jgi:hypothetical protein
MNLIQLEKEFQDLLSSPFSRKTQTEETIFDIARFPHYEKVISNIYSFFLDPNSSHGFGTLFLSCLISIIDKKTKGTFIIQSIENIEIHQEYQTINHKLIDIILVEPSEHKNTFENAIIIENKIYAEVYNDLNEYYRSINVKNQKIGIVLSLNKLSRLPKEYINITHLDYIQEIEKNIGFYFVSAQTKYTSFLQDFIQNLKTMSTSKVSSEELDFYFKYENKIREISFLYANIQTEIFKNVEAACDQLGMGLVVEAKFNSRLRYFSSQTADVYFTIWLYELFSEKSSITISVELNKEGIKYLSNVNKIKFTPTERQIIKENTAVRTSYIHFAQVTFYLTQTDKRNITDFIIEKINGSKLRSIFIKVENSIK